MTLHEKAIRKAEAAGKKAITPNMNLDQRGWQGSSNTTGGARLRLALISAIGEQLDYGSATQQCNHRRAGAILSLPPPRYKVWSPYHANTHTITGGPHFNYRGFKCQMLFIHPHIGPMWRQVELKPPDPIMGASVTSLLGPSMKTSQ